MAGINHSQADRPFSSPDVSSAGVGVGDCVGTEVACVVVAAMASPAEVGSGVAEGMGEAV